MDTLINQVNDIELSFVILSWNSEKYIEKCLDNLLDELVKTDDKFEIFIVDNGSSDSTKKILEGFKEKYPLSIFPIFLDKNTGTTYSRNLALKMVSGKYVIFMDSDVEVLPGSISGLISYISQNSNIGILAPRLIYPSGKLQKSTDSFPTLFRKFYRYFFLRFIENKEASQKQNESIHEIDYAISAVWVMRYEILNKVGFLDENIFYAPEDVDYCLRVWKAGFKIVYNPFFTSIHHTQEISRGFKQNKATWNHIKGLFYYFRKHRYMFFSPRNIRH
jgi:GT2 family glycosyltransferase